MLPQKKRLPRGEFSARGYASARTPHFSIKIKKNKPGVSRIGVIVGKAVAKSAVKRNFLKRQIKSTAKEFLKDGLDCILIAGPGAGKLTKKMLKAELSLIFTQGENSKNK